MIPSQQSQQPLKIIPLKTAVRSVAQRAIRERLGPAYVAEYGLVGCLRRIHELGDQTVAAHLNSGGNATAVAEALRREGYSVSPGTRPDYGVVLVVTGPGPTRRGGFE